MVLKVVLCLAIICLASVSAHRCKRGSSGQCINGGCKRGSSGQCIGGGCNRALDLTPVPGILKNFQ